MAKFDKHNMNSMLSYRMGWNIGEPKSPFREYNCYKLDEDKAVVFILGATTAYIVYDELPLFPSDELITKIRLLE